MDAPGTGHIFTDDFVKGLPLNPYAAILEVCEQALSAAIVGEVERDRAKGEVAVQKALAPAHGLIAILMEKHSLDLPLESIEECADSADLQVERLGDESVRPGALAENLVATLVRVRDEVKKRLSEGGMEGAAARSRRRFAGMLIGKERPYSAQTGARLLAVAVLGLIAGLVFSLVKLRAAREELAELGGGEESTPVRAGARRQRVSKGGESSPDEEMSDEAVKALLYEAAAGKALKERDAALAKAKSLTATLKEKRQFIDRANRIFKENIRLKREADAREKYISTLEIRLDRYGGTGER